MRHSTFSPSNGSSNDSQDAAPSPAFGVGSPLCSKHALEGCQTKVTEPEADAVIVENEIGWYTCNSTSRCGTWRSAACHHKGSHGRGLCHGFPRGYSRVRRQGAGHHCRASLHDACRRPCWREGDRLGRGCERKSACEPSVQSLVLDVGRANLASVKRTTSSRTIQGPGAAGARRDLPYLAKGLKPCVIRALSSLASKNLQADFTCSYKASRPQASPKLCF